MGGWKFLFSSSIDRLNSQILTFQLSAESLCFLFRLSPKLAGWSSRQIPPKFPFNFIFNHPLKLCFCWFQSPWLGLLYGTYILLEFWTECGWIGLWVFCCSGPASRHLDLALQCRRFYSFCCLAGASAPSILLPLHFFFFFYSFFSLLLACFSIFVILVLLLLVFNIHLTCKTTWKSYVYTSKTLSRMA